VAVTTEINHATSHARSRVQKLAAAPVVAQSVTGRIRRIKWAMLLSTLTACHAVEPA
jgi:hypothetical protein